MEGGAQGTCYLMKGGENSKRLETTGLRGDQSGPKEGFFFFLRIMVKKDQPTTKIMKLPQEMLKTPTKVLSNV